MHLHLSFTDPQGSNIFADTGEELSPTLLQAIGGLKETLADSMAVLAPHANSWRRFAANSYAPVSATWGVNNRSVALRVPAGSPKGRHLEHRVAGIDANPYLVAALTISGAIKGIDARTDPGPAVTGDGYAQTSTVAIPADWRSAIEVMAGSEFAASALGSRFRDVFVAVKRAELARTMREIPDTDYRLYRDVV
jgi:glutamine synthetase